MDNEKNGKLESKEKQDSIESIENNKNDEVSLNIDNENGNIDTKEKGFFGSFGNLMLVLGTIAMSAILIALIVFGVKLYRSNFSQSNNTNLNSNVESEESSEVIALSNEELTQRLDYVHAMTNTVIVAKDGLKFGEKTVDMKNIEAGLEKFKGVDNTIVEHLEKWKSGDFSSSVEFHNYIWKKLNGTIGEASSLDEKAIDEAKARLGF